MHEMTEKEFLLPERERYIHIVVTKHGFRLAVTLNPVLAKYIHRVLYLCIDYTFKWVIGSINIWEAAGFCERLKCSKY